MLLLRRRPLSAAALLSRAARPTVVRASLLSTNTGGSSSEGGGGDGGDSGGSSFLDRVVGRPDASRVRGAQKMTDQISSGRGWLDALRDGSHEMQKAKRDQQVEEQLTKLSECESFTVEYYESELSKALDEPRTA